MPKRQGRTKIKERTDSRFSIGIVEVLLCLIGVVVAVGGRTGMWLDWAEKWVSRPGAWILPVVVAIPLLSSAAHFARRSKSRLQPFRDLEATMDGTHALFLRPFFSDTKVGIPNPFFSAIWSGGFSIEPPELGPEEFVGRVLEPYINVREVGGATTIGNGRIPVSSEKWQEDVIKAANKASVTIILPLLGQDKKAGQDLGESTLWELSYLVKTGLISRAMIIMPKVEWRGRKSVRDSWERARAKALGFGMLLPEYSKDGGVLTFEHDHVAWRPAQIFGQNISGRKSLAVGLVEAIKWQAEHHGFELSTR